jgi:AcrR family transcriptional regulator
VTAVDPAPEAPARPRAGDETRERILDVAERLFVQQGYDKTSLREIAAEMGFSKAALYYHFASKADILLALHLRLHEVGLDAIHRHVGDGPTSISSWSALLQEIVDDLVAHRQLILLHTQNRAAMAALQDRHQHDESHEDLEAVLRTSMQDQHLSAADRVRLGAAMGAVFFGLVAASDSYDDLPDEVIVDGLREVVRELLGPGSTTTAPRT